jgi:hypothetical protein
MQWIEIIGRSVQGTYQRGSQPALPAIMDLLTDHNSGFSFLLCCRRRICPGIHVAERMLWLAISRLLWAFEIRPLPDEPISLEEYNGKSARMPLPYRVTLTPRHERVQALLEAEKEVTPMKL